jgi:spore germination protein KA
MTSALWARGGTDLKTPDGPAAEDMVPLPANMADALQNLRGVLESCGDIVFRSFALGGDPAAKAAVIFCSSLIDEKELNGQVLEPLMLKMTMAEGAQKEDLSALIERAGLPAGSSQVVSSQTEVANRVLTGHAAILLDGGASAIIVQVRAQEGRNVNEATVESVIRGPRESFVERLSTNLTLLRRHLPTAEFRLETMQIGRRTQTQVAVAYLADLALPKVVSEVRRRLGQIDIDSVLGSSYIEDLIMDQPLALFPTVEQTERPDKLAAALLEGRVALLVAGTPFALIVPVTMAQFLQSSEDYYSRPWFATFIRLFRYFALMIAVALPASYVAVTTYHHEMIPADLYMAIAAQREGVPWPALIEALLMESAFEMLREAGLRLPRQIGPSVSIIGGLVIGEAAMTAKIASPVMIIVVAITGVASFSLPSFTMATSLRIIRFPLMIVGGVLGLHGVVMGLIMILTHVVSLRSFGIPYFTPFAPFKLGNLKDTLVRVPRAYMKQRPAPYSRLDRRRITQESTRRGSR